MKTTNAETNAWAAIVVCATLCWLFAALPAVWTVAFANNTAMLALAFGGIVFGCGAVYARLTQFRWCFSATSLKPAVAGSF